MIGRYFLGVLTASVAVTLISMLYPGDTGGVRRALDLFLSLTLLCVIVAPIGSMIAKAREDAELELPEDISVSAPSADRAIFDSLANASRREIEEKLLCLLCEKFGGSYEVQADVSAEGGKVMLNKVTLILYGASMWEDARELRAFLAGYTDAEILIVNGG